LIPLIERLRDLLHRIQVEIGLLVEGGISWSRNVPFLLLWLGSTRYYLGEDIVGGGYLFFNGSFASYHKIQLLMDGENLTTAMTALDGKYSFSYEIPMNASWLGSHTIQATADTPNGTLRSDSIAIQIILIPTVLVLEPSSTLLTYEDQLTIRARLRDVRGIPVESSACNMTVDGTTSSFATDAPGTYTRTWKASVLDYGTHLFRASFSGEIPYGPSTSNTIAVVIDIPTSIAVSLVQTRIFIQYTIIGNGTLYANGTIPLPDKEVTVSIDGTELINVTTDENGEFIFTYEASKIGAGGHTLKVAFSHRDYIWRYSQAELGFTIFSQRKVAYPFFPHIPGWGGFGPPETFPELFIGDYAYYTWLLILVALAIAIRILQVRKARKERIEEIRLEPLEKEAPLEVPEAPVTAADLSLEIMREHEGPTAPNDRVVWYYHNLLAFLRRRRNLAIRPSMTHWELARLLRSLGYPFEHVEKITVLFERALYSGTELNDSDAIDMSMSLGNLVRVGEWGVSRAV
ncbi:MAG: DUF4129 domain-containing protein, partial [Thermoplasmata archaeon]